MLSEQIVHKVHNEMYERQINRNSIFSELSIW